MKCRLYGCFLILCTCLVAILYMQAMLHYTGRQWQLPLDDTYIYFQYARQLAHGAPWQYNAEDPPSTGTTSLIYPIVLAIGYCLGFQNDWLAIFAFSLNGIFLAVSSVLLFAIFRKIFNATIALLSASIVLLSGCITWGVFTGMEIGLFTMVFFLTAYFYQRESAEGRLKWTIVGLCLLVLARPEGLFFSVILSTGLLLLQRSVIARTSRLALVAPVLVAIAVLVIFYSTTGHFFPNSGRPKSPFYTPHFSILFIVQHAANFFLFFIKGLIGGGYTPNVLATLNRIDQYAFIAPFSLLFYLVGSLPYVAQELQQRRIGIHVILNGWFVLGVGFIGIISGSGYHHFRYLLPFLPIYVAYLIPGIQILAQGIHRTHKQFPYTPIFAGLVCYLYLFQLLTTANFILLYGQECFSFLSYKDVALWAKQNTPTDARIAALDVGMIAYYSDRYIFDLWGLVTNEMTASTFYFADYMGSKYEQIERLPAAQRPAYFFVHEVRFDERGDEAHLNPLRQHKIYTARVPGMDVYPGIGKNLSLYALDWTVSENPDRLYDVQAQAITRQLQLVGRLDVADLQSHQQYGYQFTPSVPGLFQANRLVQTTYATGEEVWDGAWGIDGRESFTLSLPTRAAVCLVMRTIFIAPAGITVQVNGQPLTVLMTPTDGKHWTEKGIWIPADHLQKGKNTIELSGQYMSAHYWFYQAHE